MKLYGSVSLIALFACFAAEGAGSGSGEDTRQRVIHVERDGQAADFELDADTGCYVCQEQGLKAVLNEQTGEWSLVSPHDGATYGRFATAEEAAETGFMIALLGGLPGELEEVAGPNEDLAWAAKEREQETIS